MRLFIAYFLKRSQKVKWVICLCCYLLMSCGRLQPKSVGLTEEYIEDREGITYHHAVYKTPTRLVNENDAPRFLDDMEFGYSMELAISRQLKYFNRFELAGTIQFGDDVYPRSMLPVALRMFRRIYRTYQRCLRESEEIFCKLSLDSNILRYFNVYEPNVNSRSATPTHFTGFYAPTLLASRRKTGRFKYAVYSKPKERRLRRLTRRQIDFENRLAGRGYEVLYTDDLFPLYLAHIQGGAKVQFVDGGDFYLHYDGDNDRTRRSIATYMRRRRMIPNRSVKAQKEYLVNHPEKHEEIYSYCPSYVYLRLSPDPPHGNIPVSLTDHRSIATDRHHYQQKGVLAFIQSKRPNYAVWRRTGESQMLDFSRFVLDQSTGGAIDGRARVDLYFGESEYANFAVHYINNYGNIFFLMPKQTEMAYNF